MVSGPAAPAYMMSLLRRRLSSGAGLVEHYPGNWIVWEPGKWNGGLAQYEPTRRPQNPGSVENLESDSLSFHLSARVPLKLGRAYVCDIVINDATVSREHLRLEPSGDTGWSLRVLSAGATVVGGVTLAVGATLLLTSGAGIRVGDVYLTFCDSSALERRLSGPR